MAWKHVSTKIPLSNNTSVLTNIKSHVECNMS